LTGVELFTKLETKGIARPAALCVPCNVKKPGCR